MASGASGFMPKPQFQSFEPKQARRIAARDGGEKAPRLAAEQAVVASLAGDRRNFADLAGVETVSEAGATDARFDAVVEQAALTPEKLARIFRQPESARSHLRAAKLSVPAPERFAVASPGPIDESRLVLAFADPTPGGEAGAALSKLLAAPVEEDLDDEQGAGLEEVEDDEALAVPDFEDTPSDAPLPRLRRSGVADAPAATKADEPKGRNERASRRQKTLAYAKPDDPADTKSGGIGQSLRSLFGGGTRARSGVAVYDISAAKVYMPDGSVLEAHSGIGKMADNPRYVSVKMNGPTPPHTYDLRMREKRFHGVEAIRMLPVDGKNKHGRTGFLTHSYLLRGGRPESHGCVAFKNYDRFLTAFKQGKVKQLVVVPSGGRATVLASNGKNI